jgi:L,D-transpeptidase ErfK/SrfK
MRAPYHTREALFVALLVWTLVTAYPSQGEEFRLPSSRNESVIGELRYTLVGQGDSLLDIARAFGIGHDEILLANPRLNRWVPRVGAEVLIPSLYVLPPGDRKGIVLNLAELRLYFFPPGAQAVHTFPVSVGDYDWRTPQGITKIVSKQVNPPWHPPKSIREEHAEDGVELPAMIPGGDPDNPLGEFALKLAIPGYLIHGTDQRRSFGIGMRVSHGCIRLYPEDIERLYSMAPVGTPVRIIDQPVKAGLLGGQLFLEVHQPLTEEEDPVPDQLDLEEIIGELRPYAREGIEIDLGRVESAMRHGDGIPTVVSSERAPEEEFWSDPYF